MPFSLLKRNEKTNYKTICTESCRFYCSLKKAAFESSNCRRECVQPFDKYFLFTESIKQLANLPGISAADNTFVEDGAYDVMSANTCDHAYRAFLLQVKSPNKFKKTRQQVIQDLKLSCSDES